MSSGTARQRLHAALADHGCQVSNGGTASTCPAHEDNAPSLSIGNRRDGAGVVLSCHAGCDTQAILAALGLTMTDLFDELTGSGASVAKPVAVATYRYVDEAGALLFEKVRLEPKSFRQRRPDGAGGWAWKLDDTRRVLYRLPDVLAAIAAGQPIAICEGEKDADNARAAGATATTWTEGAWQVGATPKWRAEYTETLRGAHVRIIRDRDDAGRHTASTIAELLRPVAASVTVFEPIEGKDLSDHLAAAHSLDELAPVSSAPRDDTLPTTEAIGGPPVPDDEGAALDDEYARQLAFNREVGDQLRKLRVRREASRILAAEDAGGSDPFDAGTLADMLARPAAPRGRVDGLIPWEAGTLIVAQRKTGKTTLTLGLARSLLTGEDFLGRFPVRAVTGRVAILNYEVSGPTLARWADEAGCPGDRLFTVNLRGRRNPLTVPEDRAALAELLRAQGVETLIVDPFGRAYNGKSQNDPGEVGAWLADLDMFARSEVAASDLVLTAHAGWNGERARGASALEDWADSIVTMTRDPQDETVRFLKAEGRDVSVDEDRLDYDPLTRRLTLTGTGNRHTAHQDHKAAELAEDVMKLLTDTPDLSGYKVGQALRGAGIPHQRGDETRALRKLVETGRVIVTSGPRNSKIYRPTPTYPTPTPAGDVVDLPRPPLYMLGEVDRGTSPPGPTPTAESPADSCPHCGDPLNDDGSCRLTCEATR